MAVDSGNVKGEALVVHVAAVEGPEVDRPPDTETLPQSQPCGPYYAHVDPVEGVDDIPVIFSQSLCDACACSRARAHKLLGHPRYEKLPGFIDVLVEPGTPSHVGGIVAEVHGEPCGTTVRSTPLGWSTQP